MKININSIQELLNDDLTLQDRGILITLLLVKDSDPKLTLAKFKAKTKFPSIKSELCKLHERGVIIWSGYEKTKEKLEQREADPKVKEVIEYLNKLYGTNYDPKTKSTESNVRQRIKEFSVEDCKLVVANRWREWRYDEVMKKYLTPSTIFRPSKFEKYLQEAKKTGQGKGLVNANKVNLEPGQEITFDMIDNLIDEDIYTVRVYNTEFGKTAGAGREMRKTGKQLKLSLKLAHDNTADEKIVFTGK